MIIQHQNNVAAFAGAHTHYWLPYQVLDGPISVFSGALDRFRSLSISRILDLTAGQTVEIVVQRIAGSGIIALPANQSSIIIRGPVPPA